MVQSEQWLAGGAYDVGHSALSTQNHGLVEAFCQVLEDPTDGGNYFDLIMTPIGDAMMEGNNSIEKPSLQKTDIQRFKILEKM